MKSIRSCLVVLLLLEGCAANDGLGTDSAAQINISHLACLSIGMSEQEALNVMHKPYSRKQFVIDDAVFDVWFYVTATTLLGQTRMVPRNLTPLTFKNGELIGWGFREYNYLLKRQRDLERNPPPPPVPAPIEPAMETSVQSMESVEPEETLKHLMPTMAKPASSSILAPTDASTEIEEGGPVGAFTQPSIPQMEPAQVAQSQAVQPAPQQGASEQSTPQQEMPKPTPQQGTSKPPAAGQATPKPSAPQQGASKPPAAGQGTPKPSAPQQGASKPPAAEQGTPKPGAPQQGTAKQPMPQQGPSSQPAAEPEPSSSKGASKKSAKGKKGAKGATGPQSQQPPSWGPIDKSGKQAPAQSPSGQQGSQPGSQSGKQSGNPNAKKKGQTSMLLSMSAKPKNGDAPSSKTSPSGSKSNQAPAPKDDKPILDEEDRRMLEEQSEQNFNQT